MTKLDHRHGFFNFGFTLFAPGNLIGQIQSAVLLFSTVALLGFFRQQGHFVFQLFKHFLRSCVAYCTVFARIGMDFGAVYTDCYLLFSSPRFVQPLPEHAQKTSRRLYG